MIEEDEKFMEISESEEEEVVEAARILVHMKLSEVDVKTAEGLHIQREEIMRRKVIPPTTKQSRRRAKSGITPELPRYPTVPESVARIMRECSHPVFKKLQISDLNPGQCKLTFMKNGVRDNFLPMLRPEDGELIPGIEVTTYDWNGVEFPMRFAAWNNSNTFVLTSGWKPFCDHHRGTMVAGDVVRVWMFRNTNRQLCVAVNLVKA